LISASVIPSVFIAFPLLFICAVTANKRAATAASTLFLYYFRIIFPARFRRTGRGGAVAA
tara:strand:- start:1200 stop:1379 length:180 start_codon:yes stop_codon:yes gene_type:complete